MHRRAFLPDKAPRQWLRWQCQFFLENPHLLDEYFKHPDSHFRRIVLAIFKSYLEVVPETAVSGKTVAELVEKYLSTMSAFDDEESRRLGLSGSKADAYRFVAHATGKTVDAVRMGYIRNKRS